VLQDIRWHSVPEDFGATLKEELIKRLKSGKWTLDSWNATSAIPFTYFLALLMLGMREI